MKKCIISMITVLVLCFALLSFGALAEDIAAEPALDGAAGIASIDDLQAAINAAPTDGTETLITLTGNIGKGQLDHIKIEGGRNITLDLAGYTMDCGMSSSRNMSAVMLSNANTKLTLKDSSVAQTGKITGGYASYGGGVNIGSKTTFVLESGAISGNTAYLGGGVEVETNGKFIMTGGTISNNTCSGSDGDGGGVYISGGSFTMTGGIISGNTAVKNGGGVMNFSSFTMTGGTISGNTAGENGGGIYVGSSYTMIVGGNAKVVSNTCGNKTNNLYLYGNIYSQTSTKLSISSETAFESGAQIGITTYKAPSGTEKIAVATDAVMSDAKYFQPDNEAYSFFLSEDTLYLGLKKTIDIEINNMTGTTPLATVTAPSGGWVEGINVFTVSCDKACVLLVTDDGGETYTRLKATAADGAYSFTASLTESSKLVCAIKGDLNLDGDIRANEAKSILSAAAGGTLSALQQQIADINGDGSVRANEAKAVLAAAAGGSLPW